MASPASSFTDATRAKWFPNKPFDSLQPESHCIESNPVSTHPVDAFIDQLRLSWVEEWQESRKFHSNQLPVEECV